MESRFLCHFALLLISVHCATADERESKENERQLEEEITTQSTAAVATTESFRHSRWYRYGNEMKEAERGYHNEDDEHFDDHDMDHDMDVEMENTKAMTQPKAEYWNGYYDFLINEGSYKFWAVFQLATAALLIYSGFAALYYAKVNPPASPDYEDYFLRRRRRRRRRRSFEFSPQERIFFSLGSERVQRILDAIAKEIH
ncbi:uncharacterized protein LOC122497958 [Leptopilina heterotoma]|uniref:uncharacterized protein LOC122497958 n=1 Tax=Leptopilina heterotoma TaxID=63436 RepID=UPI001CA8255E|nr:uncharacterized protein LOC122497958 [Leptopilina heterotoma]